MERAGKWVEEAMRKVRPSPEGQEEEERMEKEKLEEKEAIGLEVKKTKSQKGNY